jgi:hypothetical protein
MHQDRANSTPQPAPAFPRRTGHEALALLGCALALCAFPAAAQNFPITPEQRSTAQQVAQAGVPLSELAPNAPEEYTVKRGDTLWAISGMFLKSPWRWPELWGMNMQEVRNPHLIYPGQQLYLEKSGGLARLRMRASSDSGQPPTETVRVSPRVRIEPLADLAVPTLRLQLIEPFLVEPLIVGEKELLAAPRIVAAPTDRVLITRGDRAYARGIVTAPLQQKVAGREDAYRVFRNAEPIKDPLTNKVIGYEAQYLGKAALMRGEGSETVKTSSGGQQALPVPATIDIRSAKEEMQVGDRLLPEPPREFLNYAPHAPGTPVRGTIVGVHGNAVSLAGQNSVVIIDKGTAEGMEMGHVLAIQKEGERLTDTSQPGERTNIKLPNERIGLLMVFRPFEHLSYGLVLEMNDTVKIGDAVTNPR